MQLPELKSADKIRDTGGKNSIKELTRLGKHYFWLTGNFHNTEPEATDTDEWALEHQYVSIVPMHTDLTCYNTLKVLGSLGL